MKRHLRHFRYTCDHCHYSVDGSSLFTNARSCECSAHAKLEIDGKPPEFRKSASSGKYIMPRVKSLGEGASRIYGAWTPVVEDDQLSIFYACVCCGAINDLSDLRVWTSGRANCFHCGYCRMDQFIHLGGWKPFSKMSRKFLTTRYVFANRRVVDTVKEKI